MEGKAKPEYEKCVEISTAASIREMIAPGAIALISPALIGFLFGPEALGGLLAGITVSGVLMGIFQNNAGGAWDNAKKSFEAGVEVDGKIEYKGSEPHKASVTGDTVGDPFKDTSGPSMNILIKLTSIVALIIAPHIAESGHSEGHQEASSEETSAVEEMMDTMTGVETFKAENARIDVQGTSGTISNVYVHGIQMEIGNGKVKSLEISVEDERLGKEAFAGKEVRLVEFSAERIWRHGSEFVGHGQALIQGMEQQAMEATVRFQITSERTLKGSLICQDLG